MSVMTKNILLINLNSQFPFDETLIDNGLVMTTSYSTLECFYLLHRHQYNLVFLNIDTPKFCDFGLLINLTNACHVPILLFSKNVEKFDLIHALELGASDYYSHDISPRELLARIRAHTRSQSKDATRREVAKIVLNDVLLCRTKREVYCSEQAVAFTGVEFELLYFLMANAGQVLSREILGKVLFNRVIINTDRSLDVHISNIRKKLNSASQRERIQTIRGNGYVYLNEQIKPTIAMISGSSH